MPAYRILVVDDQHEVRRMLSAGLRTLGAEIEVVEVPSGEEALLVASRLPVDLLVSDIRLPGITGLELVGRVHQRNPELRTILVTGLTDPKIHQQMAEAGASAFFYKPIKISEFLDAVERCLGLEKTFFPPPTVVEPVKPAPVAAHTTLDERLAELRKDLKASAILWLDHKGEVRARAGDLPNADLEGKLLSTLLVAMKAEARLAATMGMKATNNLLCVSGAQYGLYASHTGLSSAILAIIPHAAKVDLGATERLLTAAGIDMQIRLAEGNEQSQPIETEAEFQALQEIEGVENPSPSDLPEIDAIFDQVTQQPVTSTDLDAFWDSLAEQSVIDSPLEADTLTFEQAKKLGLTPKEEIKPSHLPA